MSLERCRELLNEVTKLHERIQESATSSHDSNPRSDQQRAVSERTNPTGGPGGGTPQNLAQRSQRVSVLNPNPAGFEEHHRLFGFNPASSKRKKDGDHSRFGTKKNKNRPTWTRTFVCLAQTDVERMPSVKENIVLKGALLGEKRLTFFADDNCHVFDQKLRLAYPKLEQAGGYSLLRGGHSRMLQPLNPPYHVSRLKELVGQGKIFVRPLQRDLELTQEGRPVKMR